MSTTSDGTNIIKSKNPSKVMLLLSALVFIFYLCTHLLTPNVYKYAFVGALFELLSIPMLLLLVTIPIVCIVQLIKLKGTARWYAAASLFLIATTIYILIQTA